MLYVAALITATEWPLSEAGFTSSVRYRRLGEERQEAQRFLIWTRPCFPLLPPCAVLDDGVNGTETNYQVYHLGNQLLQGRVFDFVQHPALNQI